jgi:hypothetical protein
VNAYTTEFFARCPNNNIRIKYRLRIETREMLSVEDIVAAVELPDEGYHEEIADQMLKRFGGVQTLVAEHHGVTIETTRA